MESYCGDYSQYYPSWTGWGEQVANSWTSADGYFGPKTLGTFTLGSRPAEEVYVAVTLTADNRRDKFAYFNPVINFRTIFTGSRSMNAWSNTPAGELVMAPNGLGFLLTGGYMGDAKTFFCPSSIGMPMSDLGVYNTNHYAATEVRDLLQAGGTEAKTMLTGDWNWLWQWSSRYSPTRTVLSHYNYRNVPTSGMNAYWTPEKENTRLFFMNPNRDVKVGEPIFKTQKQAAGRALVVDSFDKGLDKPDTDPGAGVYAHRDGYNVLYSDSSASWYGDTQQKLIYWPQHVSLTGEKATMRGLSVNCLGDVWYTDLPSAPPGPPYDYSWDEGPVQIWHQFDLHHGIDVDTVGYYTLP